MALKATSLRVNGFNKVSNFIFLSQMDGEEIFDAFNASGSTDIKFGAGMFKQEDMKQENFDGWYYNV